MMAISFLSLFRLFERLHLRHFTYTLNDWLSVSGEFGYQSAENFDDTHGIGFPYTMWSAGTTATWKQFALDVRYIDASISKNECTTFNGPDNGNWCTQGVLATLTFNFSAP